MPIELRIPLNSPLVTDVKVSLSLFLALSLSRSVSLSLSLSPSLPLFPPLPGAGVYVTDVKVVAKRFKEQRRKIYYLRDRPLIEVCVCARARVCLCLSV